MGEPNIFPRITDVSGTNAVVHIQVEEAGGVTTRNKRSISYALIIPSVLGNTPCDWATGGNNILEVLDAAAGTTTDILT
jgi:hypothetical protein